MASLVDTAELERHDRLSPATAGVLMGALGGAAAMGAAEELVLRRGGPDLAARAGDAVGNLLAGGNLFDHSLSRVVGFVTVAVAGALLGVVYALTTRLLRRYAPLLVWSLVLCAAACTLVYAFVLPRWAPHLRDVLPFGVSLLAGSAYAFVVSLALPLRRRASRPFYADADAADADDLDEESYVP